MLEEKSSEPRMVNTMNIFFKMKVKAFTDQKKKRGEKVDQHTLMKAEEVLDVEENAETETRSA